MKNPVSSLRAVREQSHENIYLLCYDDPLEMLYDKEDMNLGVDKMPENKLIVVVVLLEVESRP